MITTKGFLLLGLLAAGLTGARVVPVRADNGPPVVKITASKFRFTPDHIILIKGQPVTLELTSTDRAHGFLLRALKIDAAVQPGATTALTVTPQTAGTFKAICDHYCGLGHSGMKMTVEVRESVAHARAPTVASAANRQTP